MPSPRPRDRQVGARLGDEGNALVEFTWLGILLLVPLVWIMLAVFDVQRGSYGVSAAARAGARAYSLSADDASGRASAQQAVGLAMTDQGMRAADAEVQISCSQQPCHSPGAVVTVRVHSRVALPWLPSILGASPSFSLDARQSAPMGTFRDFG